MTTCGAAGRLVTKSSAKRRRFWLAMHCWPARLRCWPTDIEPPAVAAKCCAMLGKAAGATALVGGQAADLEMAGRCRNKSTAVSKNSKRFTGVKRVPSLAASLELGGMVANATSEQLAALAIYGEKVGMAFQITDDLLDVTGNQAAVGKRGGKGRRPRQTDISAAYWACEASREQADYARGRGVCYDRDIRLRGSAGPLANCVCTRTN